MLHLLRDVDFELFIDRDPLPYPHILNYLRGGKIRGEVKCVEALQEEAEYLGLEELQGLARGLPDVQVAYLMCR